METALEQMATRVETHLADRLREMETRLLEEFDYWGKRIESSASSL